MYMYTVSFPFPFPFPFPSPALTLTLTPTHTHTHRYAGASRHLNTNKRGGVLLRGTEGDAKNSSRKVAGAVVVAHLQAPEAAATDTARAEEEAVEPSTVPPVAPAVPTRNVRETFRAYGLPSPEIVRLDLHHLSRHLLLDPTQPLFNCIVTDPPYGIRAGGRKTGRQDGLRYACVLSLSLSLLYVCSLITHTNTH